MFQGHGVDGAGAVAIRRRIGRAKVLVFFADLALCLIRVEACPSAHHWGRELESLGPRPGSSAPQMVGVSLGSLEGETPGMRCHELMHRVWFPGGQGVWPLRLWQSIATSLKKIESWSIDTKSLDRLLGVARKTVALQDTELFD